MERIGQKGKSEDPDEEKQSAGFKSEFKRGMRAIQGWINWKTFLLSFPPLPSTFFSHCSYNHWTFNIELLKARKEGTAGRCKNDRKFKFSGIEGRRGRENSIKFPLQSSFSKVLNCFWLPHTSFRKSSTQEIMNFIGFPHLIRNLASLHYFSVSALLELFISREGETSGICYYKL